MSVPCYNVGGNCPSCGQPFEDVGEMCEFMLSKGMVFCYLAICENCSGDEPYFTNDYIRGYTQAFERIIGHKLSVKAEDDDVSGVVLSDESDDEETLVVARGYVQTIPSANDDADELEQHRLWLASRYENVSIPDMYEGAPTTPHRSEEDEEPVVTPTQLGGDPFEKSVVVISSDDEASQSTLEVDDGVEYAVVGLPPVLNEERGKKRRHEESDEYAEAEEWAKDETWANCSTKYDESSGEEGAKKRRVRSMSPPSQKAAWHASKVGGRGEE